VADGFARPLARAVLLIAACIAFVACGMMPSTSLPSWTGSCGLGVGRDAILHGSAADIRVAWATERNGGGRTELLWPRSYTARFDPQLEILDESGLVVAREGDLITGSCLGVPGDHGAIRISGGDVRPSSWKPGDG
jgi:hypothetical protein